MNDDDDDDDDDDDEIMFSRCACTSKIAQL